RGFRSWVSVPLIQRGDPIGVLALSRHVVSPFSEREIALLETFADQAAIAIENARLFQELQGRNRDLSEALEQQTVTAEVLRVIASSPTDLGHVLQEIVDSAARLIQVDNAGIMGVDGDELVGLANLKRTQENYAVGTRRPVVR